jgi:hypothetical protein
MQPCMPDPLRVHAHQTQKNKKVCLQGLGGLRVQDQAGKLQTLQLCRLLRRRPSDAAEFVCLQSPRVGKTIRSPPKQKQVQG